MKRHLILFALLLCGALSWGEKPRAGDDPIAQALFPPEIIMKYHNEIALDDNQSKNIKELVQKAQSRFLDMQWEMQGEAEKLVKLLNGRPVDEGAVLAQMDRVLNLEREIKKAQVSLMVRIKNTLTAAQQDKLTELRRK